MRRFEILHRTSYDFYETVDLGAHILRLRPREGPDLRIESSTLSLTPHAEVCWHRDLHDNAIATAIFRSSATQLMIESGVVVQQYNENPFDFLTESHAVDFPFSYGRADGTILAPYLSDSAEPDDSPFVDWAASVWNRGDAIETIPLLLRLADRIQSDFSYRRREEPGVQSPAETLALRTGSCRDFAALFMAVARLFGLAARFVSGYLYENAGPSQFDSGATHAWAEIYIPGVGWKGFDPTLGLIIGPDHIPVAVGRLPDAVPPVEGTFTGRGASTMTVGVSVTSL